MSYERPKHIPFPKVWSRFQGKVPIDGKPLNYVIQDITDDLVQPVLDHLCTYFIVREVTVSSIGLTEDKVAVEELRELWEQMIKEKLSVVCLVEGEGETKRIAGCNIIKIRRKDEAPKKYRARKTAKMVACAEWFHDKVNVFEKYGVDIYVDALGLSVSPEYQGDGVGYELIKTRIPLCKSIGIPLFATLFSSAVAKNEALKVGYEVIFTSTWDKVEFEGKVAYPRLRSEAFLCVMIVPIDK